MTNTLAGANTKAQVWFETPSWPSERHSKSGTKSVAKKAAQVATEKTSQKLDEKAAKKGSDMTKKN